MKIKLFLTILGIWGIVHSAFAQNDSSAIKNLVLEGAGIRGIAYCGALIELEERGMLSSLETISGTSSGAITACFYSVGYTPTEIYDEIGNTNFGQFNDGRWGMIGGLYRLKRDFGYYPGQVLLSWIEDHIEVKTGTRDLTFAQLKQLADNHDAYSNLIIASTSLNHQRTIYFSAESYPNMRIADAVHASMAVPLYFEPVAIDSEGKVVEISAVNSDHHLCADGGITANFMIDYFDCYPPHETLGVRIDSAEQIEKDQSTGELAYHQTGDLNHYVQAFYCIIKETMNRSALVEQDWDRTISIEDCAIGPKVKQLSQDQKMALIEAGKKGVEGYYTNEKG